MKILDLPFIERPVLELLDLDKVERAEVNRDYAGYGWARVPAVWLGDDVRVDDALVLALHAADDGAALPDDIELLFELPDQPPAIVNASQFLAQWIPTLPRANAIVLALCNPHRAELRYPTGAGVPVYVASGDVEAWIDDDKGGRIELSADGSWARLTA